MDDLLAQPASCRSGGKRGSGFLRKEATKLVKPQGIQRRRAARGNTPPDVDARPTPIFLGGMDRR